MRTELAEIEMERLREDQDRLRCEDAIKMEKRLSIRLRKEMQEREFALSVERNAYVVVCDLKNPNEKKTLRLSNTDTTMWKKIKRQHRRH